MQRLTRPALQLSVLTALCSAPLACDEGPSPDDEAESLRASPYADDPALFGPHCTEEADFFRPEDGTQPNAPEIPARLYYPIDCGAGGLPKDTPLVLFHVANGGFPGYDYDTYEHLGEHLASHGFMVAVIAPASGLPLDDVQRVTRRAELTLDYLDYLMSSWWGAPQIATDKLALAGHSQGGEAAIIAAKLLDEGGLPYQVGAVLSLAPTQFTDTVLDHWMTPFFLTLYGSRDEDVSGRFQLDPPITPSAAMRTAFAHYDRFGTEWNPWLFEDCVTKAMKFVHGWNHKTFAEQPFASHQMITTSGYLNAALRWRLLGQDEFEPWMIENDIPASGDSGNFEVFSQFQDGEWMARRVIDNFENPWFATSTIGGALTSFGSGEVTYGEWAWADDQSAPHGDTHVLIMQPDFIGERLRWTIPPAEGDVSKFRVLSLRIGQMLGHGIPAAKSVSLRVRSNGQWSGYLSSDDYGEIPTPHVVDLPTAQPAGDYTKSPMVTIRVPLLDFGVDLETIEEVELYYAGVDEIGTRWMLDNVEFSR